MIKAIVTDVEGTTSSLAFVKDVLFPYAAKHLPEWLSENQLDANVRQQIESVAETIGRPACDLDAVTEQLLSWIEQDVKAPPLKALQGMIWKSGYETKAYRAHVYEDAVEVLKDWADAAIPLYVYSSGSVQAQKLFFQYSEFGDLLELFSGHFDTTTGPKNDIDSYRKIAAAIGFPAADIVFLSDAEAEVSAAMAAGMQSILVVRGEEVQLDTDANRYTVARDFHEIVMLLRTGQVC